MGERMIERALDIDAEVTVLDGGASETLADFDRGRRDSSLVDDDSSG